MTPFAERATCPPRLAVQHCVLRLALCFSYRPCVVARVTRFAKFGVLTDVLLIILQLLSYVLFDNTGFDALGMSLPKVIGLYTVGGLLAGAFVGVVSPAVKSILSVELCGRRSEYLPVAQ